MGQTVVEKIALSHMTSGLERRPLRAGDFLCVRPEHVMTHDNTAAVMTKFRALGVSRIRDPRQPVFVLDHDIQNTSDANVAKYRSIEEFALRQGIDFYPAGSGIGHQVMCEQLYVTPGSFVVASDSHSNMYGAMGAIGTPVVRTDAAAIWATGEFWWQVPRTVRVTLDGALPEGATGKDVIIVLCGRYNRGEVLNAALEFGGPGVATLSMDERMSIANMTTEWGALVGWFPTDATTVGYIRERAEILAGRGIERIDPKAVARLEADSPGPDGDAAYAAEITVDLTRVTPHVSGPDSVQVMTALSDLEPRRIRIHKAYLVSCVNSRLEDLEAAASVLEGNRIAEGVALYVAAASREVQHEAERRGVWRTLIEAGAAPLPPGCGPCIGLGTGVLEPGEVGISATNRNFKGRMGSRDAECYLASPAVVAASAIAGYIRGPGKTAVGRLATRIADFEPPPSPEERVGILPGFPRRVSGRMVFLPQDNLNTDGIYGKDHTYRDDMTPEMMARVAMHNYDPRFGAVARTGDVLVGASNFGTGSSREQAVTSLRAAGIAMIVAASFSQTYLRNAFNNGFPCIECPDLVARLRELLAAEIAAGRKTIVPGDAIEVDFETATVTYREENYRFAPLGSVPQSLVVAGGVENQLRATLGLG